VPARLDGTGAAAVVVAGELLAAADEGLAPLREEHAKELAERADQAEMTGARGVPGRKQLEDGHKREERRWRTDDLRFGLTTLAAIYRDRLAATAGIDGRDGSAGSSADARRGVRNLAAIDEASVALGRNANESLLMESLMVELSGMID
jgi:DNA polymerase-3 subunit delta'